MGDLALLDGARYLLLTTFRANGEGVATPVWFARTAPDRVVLTTEATAGKVRRLRDDARCTVAPCDVRGRTDVPAVDATARELVGAERDAAERALASTYGLAWRAFGVMARLRGRDPATTRTYLEVRAV